MGRIEEDPVALPQELHDVLLHGVDAMRRGLSVMVSPTSQTLTTQQAAERRASRTAWNIDDEHVVAAAVLCTAEVIVTENLGHFPAGHLPAPLRAIPAREFVHDTVRAHLTPSCRAVIAICERSGRHGPRLTVADLLTILEERYRMTEAVAMLSAAPALREALS